MSVLYKKAVHESPVDNENMPSVDKNNLLKCKEIISDLHNKYVYSQLRNKTIYEEYNSKFEQEDMASRIKNAFDISWTVFREDITKLLGFMDCHKCKSPYFVGVRLSQGVNRKSCCPNCNKSLTLDLPTFDLDAVKQESIIIDRGLHVEALGRQKFIMKKEIEELELRGGNLQNELERQTFERDVIQGEMFQSICTEGPPVKCSECQTLFSSMTSALEHMKRVHNDVEMANATLELNVIPTVKEQNIVQRNIPDSSTVQHKASAALAKPDAVVKDVSNVILKQNLTPVRESKIQVSNCQENSNEGVSDQRALNTWRGRLQHFLQLLNSKMNKKMIVI